MTYLVKDLRSNMGDVREERDISASPYQAQGLEWRNEEVNWVMGEGWGILRLVRQEGYITRLIVGIFTHFRRNGNMKDWLP